MLADTYIVGVNENRRFALDCQGWLQTGETVLDEGSIVSVTPQTSPEFFIPFIFVSQGRYAVFFTGGGKEDETYIAEFLIPTNFGQRRTVCVQFKVSASCDLDIAV